MCGIAAYLARRSFDPEIIRQMTQLVRHRGPDDEGTALFAGRSSLPSTAGGGDTPQECYTMELPYAPKGDGHAELPDEIFLGLGHRRLSIIDVHATGHQPMCSPDGECWIVHNGEVYNYLELRCELKSLGYAFVSGTDTEVILHAYREWGVDCLSRFNGMFAFVIFDRRTNKLFVARDRFGIKPLYYWISPRGDIAFVSEIKQLTCLPGWRPKVNGQRIYDFLVWAHSDHTEETSFAEVYQLLGGEYIELDVSEYRANVDALVQRKCLMTRRWYTLRAQEFSGKLSGAAATFHNLLRESVRLRLRADVSVGSCLSGGLDSSSIVSLLDLLSTPESKANQKVFSAYAEEGRWDEREYAQEVVRQTGFEHHSVTPSVEELFDELGRITWHQDEPFGTTSIFAQWNVFCLAATNNVKVMLDGQGADEQLVGYHQFFAPHFAGLFKRREWRKLWREMRATKRLHGYPESRAARQVASMLLASRVPERVKRWRWIRASDSEPAWLNLAVLGAQPVDVAKVFGTRSDSVTAASTAQMLCTVLPRLLHWEDRNSMAHSVESRLPFLDYRLVEFVLGLPDHFKLKEGVTKRVLREGMKGVLPEKIRTRVSKLGFETPEEIWVRERRPEAFVSALRDAFERSEGILNELGRDQVEGIIRGTEPFSYVLWRIISFGAWQKQFRVTT